MKISFLKKRLMCKFGLHQGPFVDERQVDRRHLYGATMPVMVLHHTCSGCGKEVEVGSNPVWACSHPRENLVFTMHYGGAQAQAGYAPFDRRYEYRCSGCGGSVFLAEPLAEEVK